MRLINHVKGTTTKQIHYFDVLRNYYDNSNDVMELVHVIHVFNRTYVIDKKIDNSNNCIIYGHRYDTVRQLKHEIVFTINWDSMSYDYELKKYSIA